MNTPKLQHYDLIIAGGGMVGASLALGLKDSSKRILVVEAVAPDNEFQQSFDERTVALTYSSRLIFEKMGVWHSIENSGATAITNIHISDRGHFGMTHLHADMVGTQALGYVVPTRHIGDTLWQALRETDDIEIACPASISQCTQKAQHVVVDIQQNNQSHQVSADLIAIADGGRSGLATKLGLISEEKPYDSQAILCFITTNKAHQGRAFERFTDEGPIALLPYNDKQYACVWTSDNDNAQMRLSLNENDFLTQLQQHFGFRAGRFLQCTPRKSYALARTELSAMATQNAVLIGNAAHKVHPVAGQGFNLGLRDAACLINLLQSHWQSDKTNLNELVLQYQHERESEAKRVSWFTHSLIEIFSQTTLPIKLARGGLLKSIELMPFVKRQLLKRTMGISRKHRSYYAKY